MVEAAEAWSFQVAPELYFYRVDAKDTSGFESSLASKSIVPGLSLGAKYGLNEETNLFGQFGFSSVDMKTSSTQDTISNSQNIFGRASVGAEYKLSTSSYFGLSMGLSRQFYIERANNSNLQLVLLDIPEVSAFYFTQIHQSSFTALAVEAQVSSLFEASKDSVKASSGFAGRLALAATVPNLGVPALAQIYYEYRQQNSNIEKWQATQLGFVLNIEMGVL